MTQEKNDLREEKATLKSDIDRLNVQCQQRVGSTYPWVAMDSVLPHPSSYAYHMPIPVASAPSYAPTPMHIPMQPYSFFGSANPGMFANPCSTFVPYVAPNPPAEQPSTQEVSPSIQPGSRTQVSAKQGVGTSSDRQERRSSKKEDSDDVPTNLELKTPGSTTDEVCAITFTKIPHSPCMCRDLQTVWLLVSVWLLVFVWLLVLNGGKLEIV